MIIIIVIVQATVATIANYDHNMFAVQATVFLLNLWATDDGQHFLSINTKLARCCTEHINAV
jgi:hypothetical protein